MFTRNKVVNKAPPPEISGEDILKQLRDFSADKTVEVGGNGHVRTDGYGINHNWHKKSIFWELLYWKDHMLRHNLDVMHIENNFFENIMNTILNVQGKTKDNLKSRLDLPAICERSELHVMSNGKGPTPIFRLNAVAKKAFFQWIIDNVKFPDGYASNLSRCVDINNNKLSGMKSHDCHVFMQRLLTFAFKELLPKKVHDAVSGIKLFILYYPPKHIEMLTRIYFEI